jgi:hypothetical protein
MGSEVRKMLVAHQDPLEQVSIAEGGVYGLGGEHPKEVVSQHNSRGPRDFGWVVGNLDV